MDSKRVGSGLLLQTADNHEINLQDLKIVTQKQPTAAQMQDLLFAWRVAKYVKSNAIVFCGNGMTLGVGAGQMSRVGQHAHRRDQGAQRQAGIEEFSGRIRCFLSFPRWCGRAG